MDSVVCHCNSYSITIRQIERTKYMSKHKSIKALIRKLTTLTIYNAEQIISTEHKLETEIVPMLKQNSMKHTLYQEILSKAKELNILATASVMQSTHAKLATSIQIESIQRELVALASQL